MFLNINKNFISSQCLSKADVGKNLSVVKIKPYQGNSHLQAQLNFMGVVNKPLVNTSTLIFNKYLEKMAHCKIEGGTILYHPDKNASKIIILDKSEKFSDGITLIKKTVDEFRKNNTRNIDLICDCNNFNLYSEQVKVVAIIERFAYKRNYWARY